MHIKMQMLKGTKLSVLIKITYILPHNLKNNFFYTFTDNKYAGVIKIFLI